MTNPAIQDGRGAIRQALLDYGVEVYETGSTQHHHALRAAEIAMTLIDAYAARERAAGAAEALTRWGFEHRPLFAVIAEAVSHLQACEDKLREAMG